MLTLQIYCQGSVALIWIYILLGGRKNVKEQSRYIICSSTISISFLPGYRYVEKLSARIMKMSSVRSTPADREYKAAFSVVFHQKLKNLLDEEQSTNMELLAKFSKKIKLLVKHFSGKLIYFYIFYHPPPHQTHTFASLKTLSSAFRFVLFTFPHYFYIIWQTFKCACLHKCSKQDFIFNKIRRR